MIIYMLVTKDRFELPVIVADSAADLARKLNIDPNLIHSAISHAKKKGIKSQYVKVECKEGRQNERN